MIYVQKFYSKKLKEKCKTRFYHTGKDDCLICAERLIGHVSTCPNCKVKFHAEHLTTMFYENENVKCPFCRCDMINMDDAHNDDEVLRQMNLFHDLVGEKPFERGVSLEELKKRVERFKPHALDPSKTMRSVDKRIRTKTEGVNAKYELEQFAEEYDKSGNGCALHSHYFDLMRFGDRFYLNKV